MKKTIVLFLGVALAIGLYAFTPSSKARKQKKETATNHIWWDFNGTESQMDYNVYYSPDPNNFPDCAPSAGLVYCEVYAATDPESDPEDPKPDLSTITQYRNRPL